MQYSYQIFNNSCNNFLEKLTEPQDKNNIFFSENPCIHQKGKENAYGSFLTGNELLSHSTFTIKFLFYLKN